MRKVSGRALVGFQDKMNGGQRRASQRDALSGETKANKPVNGNPKFPRKSPSQTHAHGGVGFGSRAVPHRQRSSGARLAAEEYTIITIHASPFPQFPSSSDKYSVVAIRWLHESDRGSKRLQKSRTNWEQKRMSPPRVPTRYFVHMTTMPAAM